MLKPLEQTVIDEIELKSPNCFSLESKDSEILIIFNHPGINELIKFRKDLENHRRDAQLNMMYSCVLAPNVVDLKKELDEDYLLSKTVQNTFASIVKAPYGRYFVEELEEGNFCIKNPEEDVVATFKKPGKHENKRYQKALESDNPRGSIEFMLDCVIPKEDRPRFSKLIDDNILLQVAVATHFLNKVTEHVNIKMS